MLLLQLVDGVQAVQNSMPSSWVDEPHEQFIWALLFAITSYISKQLWDRRAYTRATREAAEKLNNPRSDRTINEKTANSATLLNYVIDDIRELRDDTREIRGKQDDVLKRLEDVAYKDDIKRLDTEIRDIRKRLN